MSANHESSTGDDGAHVGEKVLAIFVDEVRGELVGPGCLYEIGVSLDLDLLAGGK